MTYFSCLLIEVGVACDWDLGAAKMSLSNVNAVMVVKVDEASTNDRFPVY